MYFKKALLVLAITLGLTACSHSPQVGFNQMSIEELKKEATSIHPSGLYVLASKLFKSGKRDESVFWFYVGQLRYRFYLAANPTLSASGDPALFGSLQSEVGGPINTYAGGDPEFWANTMKKAREWDKLNPNHFTSKEQFQKEYHKVLQGMGTLISSIEDNKEIIRLQRIINGLKNR